MEVGRGHREDGHHGQGEGESDRSDLHHNSRRGEEGSGDGSDRDVEESSHGVGAGRDHRSSRLHVGSRHHGRVEVSESGSDRCVERLAGAVAKV